MTEPSRLDLAAKYLPHCSPLLELRQATGSWLYGPGEDRYLDFGSGGLNCPLGHQTSAPAFVLREHLEHYLYPGDPDEIASLYVVEYAQELSSWFPSEDDVRQVLVCSGVPEARQVINRLVDKPGAVEVRAISAGHSLNAVATDVVTDARAQGQLVIADETVSGFGRTGKFLGADHLALSPDIVLFGPPGAGGLPFAAVVAPQSVFDAVDDLGPVFTSPLACAAAWSVLKAMGVTLFDYVVSMGTALETAISELTTQFPDRVAGLTGVGLLAQLHLTDDGDIGRFRQQCWTRGLIMGADLTLTPPLTVTKDEITAAADVMAEVLLEWEET